MRRYSIKIRGIILLIGGGILLNGILSMYAWLPEYRFLSLFKPSVELAVIYLPLFGISFLRKKTSGILAAVITLVVVVLFFYSLGETVTRHLYRRSFSPWEDLRYFPEFFRLLFDTRAPAKATLYITASCFVLGLLCIGIYFLLMQILQGTRKMWHPFRLLAVFYGFFLLMVAVFGYGYSFRDNLFTRLSAAATPSHTERAALTVESGTEEIYQTDGEKNSLSLLRNRNVLLFVVESYGYTAFSKEDHFVLLKPFFEETEKKLRAAGYDLTSNFLGSPVIGGYSWFADATFLCGERIRSTDAYNALLSSDRATLVDFFNESGYETVLVAPGTLEPWPEGERFYGFDRYFYAASFDYRGPEFSFVPITDQFAVHTAHETLLAGKEGPYFIEYLLVSSHAPFNRIPAYVEEWEDLGDGSIYNTLEMRQFQNTWVYGKEYTEGYTAAVRYVLTVLSEYLARFIHDDALIIIIGDHQPKFPVTEKGTPLSVPIHVICRDSEVVDGFEEYGFQEGIIPAQNPPHRGMEAFLPLFLRLFSDTDGIDPATGNKKSHASDDGSQPALD